MTHHASSVVLALAAVLTLFGCSPSETPNSIQTPPNTATETPTASPTPQAMALYFVADTSRGLRLYREFHRIDVADDPMASAVEALLSTTPTDPDYANLWGTDTELLGITRNGKSATINISQPRLNVGSEGEERAIDQLVWTATAAAPEITSIRIHINGRQVETLAGAVDLSSAFVRGESWAVLAPVWITSAEHGATLSSPLTFEGIAQVFEANVNWEVRRGNATVKRGFTTAAEAAPARAPFEITVLSIPAGTYTIRVFALSAEDGSLVAEDSKVITIK